MHMLYGNVHQDVIFISFHCAMIVCVHLDALIIVARVLYDVNCCLLTELDVLSFSLHFVCASYEHELYMCFVLNHAIFTVLSSMYFFVPCGECNKLVK